MQRMRAHLDEDAGSVLDVLAEQLDREVLRLDEEGIATLGALWRDTRFQPLRAMDLPLRRTCLGDRLLLRQSLAHGVAQGQITREVHRIHPRQEWRDALSCRSSSVYLLAGFAINSCQR